MVEISSHYCSNCKQLKLHSVVTSGSKDHTVADYVCTDCGGSSMRDYMDKIGNLDKLSPYRDFDKGVKHPSVLVISTPPSYREVSLPPSQRPVPPR